MNFEEMFRTAMIANDDNQSSASDKMNVSQGLLNNLIKGRTKNIHRLMDLKSYVHDGVFKMVSDLGITLNQTETQKLEKTIQREFEKFSTS